MKSKTRGIILVVLVHICFLASLTAEDDKTKNEPSYQVLREKVMPYASYNRSTYDLPKAIDLIKQYINNHNNLSRYDKIKIWKFAGNLYAGNASPEKIDYKRAKKYWRKALSVAPGKITWTKVETLLKISSVNTSRTNSHPLNQFQLRVVWYLTQENGWLQKRLLFPASLKKASSSEKTDDFVENFKQELRDVQDDTFYTNLVSNAQKEDEMEEIESFRRFGLKIVSLEGTKAHKGNGDKDEEIMEPLVNVQFPDTLWERYSENILDRREKIKQTVTEADHPDREVEKQLRKILFQEADFRNEGLNKSNIYLALIGGDLFDKRIAPKMTDKVESRALLDKFHAFFVDGKKEHPLVLRVEADLARVAEKGEKKWKRLVSTHYHAAWLSSLTPGELVKQVTLPDKLSQKKVTKNNRNVLKNIQKFAMDTFNKTGKVMVEMAKGHPERQRWLLEQDQLLEKIKK